MNEAKAKPMKAMIAMKAAKPINVYLEDRGSVTRMKWKLSSSWLSASFPRGTLSTKQHAAAVQVCTGLS